jgi:hypothetical protein
MLLNYGFISTERKSLLNEIFQLQRLKCQKRRILKCTGYTTINEMITVGNELGRIEKDAIVASSSPCFSLLLFFLPTFSVHSYRSTSYPSFFSYHVNAEFLSEEGQGSQKVCLQT